MGKNLSKEKSSEKNEESYSELLKKAQEKLKKNPKINWVVIKTGHTAIKRVGLKEKILPNEICRWNGYGIVDISPKKIKRRM